MRIKSQFFSEMRILGVDPGFQFVGYGCIKIQGKKIAPIVHGTLKVKLQSEDLAEDRLFRIYEGLSQIILETKPHVMVVEKVFFAKNVLSALKLGQARGVVMLTGRIHQLGIFEYSATEVKQAIVGYGRADKHQVAKMIEVLLGKQKFQTLDASDSLALAICHAHLSENMKNNLQFHKVR